ncbi:MAG: hypothetical protein RMM29_09040 [Planctomycetota bacterium]|nr:hypothetical protein [Planctomycetota bacterium]MDW8373772.1 hypothetical protein [Planctomycetota bacterium]
MRHTLHFVGQMARHFRQTGAVVPSSSRLGRAMALALDPVPEAAVIVELGAGGGAVTSELLALHPQARLIAIENNPSFAARLRQRLPRVAVVEGCASDLSQHLAELGIARHQLHAVVSGLPLLSLPEALVQQLLAALRNTLLPTRLFVQFTYSGRAFGRLPLHGFRLERRQRVWWNLPPAVVLRYARLADDAG